MRKIVAIALVAVPVLVACGKAKESKTLAVVDGRRITAEDFLREADRLPPYIKPILETPEGRKTFLDGMVNRDLLMREALRRGIDRRPEVQERIELARRQAILEGLLRDETEKAAGDEAAMRRYYEQNRETFRVGERVKVSHLMHQDQETAAEFAERARGGAPFEALMKEARDVGGAAADLGLIERGSFVKEFEDAAFATPPGTVSGPVKSPYGYHVIKVVELRPAGIKSFDEVKLQLVAEAREKVRQQTMDKLVDALKKRSDVRYLVNLGDETAGPGKGGKAKGEGGAPAPEGKGAPAGAPAGVPGAAAPVPAPAAVPAPAPAAAGAHAPAGK